MTTNNGNVLQQHWLEDRPSVWHIYAVDVGQQHLHCHGVPAIYPPFQPAIFSAYAVWGVFVPGWRLAWHHKVHVKRTPLTGGSTPLHYHQHKKRSHQHKKRREGQLDPPAIKPNGSHWLFKSIQYGTQVQNYRRAMGGAGGGDGDDEEEEDSTTRSTSEP